MSVATSTALAIIGSAATAATTVYSAKKQSDANKDAAKTQAASDDKALAQAKVIYDTQRGDQQPFRESGYGALDALNYGLGLPAVQRGNVSAPTRPDSTINGQTFPGEPQVNSPERQSTLTNLGGVYGNLGNKMQAKLTEAQTRLHDQYGGAGATVKIKAPNGLVYLVPSARAQEAQQQGGQLV